MYYFIKGSVIINMLRGKRIVTQSLKTTALMCTVTGDIAQLAILKDARIVLQKIFLIKDFSACTKSQRTINSRVSQLGMLALLGGARKHSRVFKTAYRFLSCNKSVFIFTCSVFSVAHKGIRKGGQEG